MASSQATSADFVWIKIVAPGDDCNIYTCDKHSRTMRLAGVHRTETPQPLDVGIIPDSAPPDEDELPVLLFRHRALFPNCAVSARPLGLLTLRNKTQTHEIVVAVPGADDAWADWREIEDVPAAQRSVVAALAATVYNTDGESSAVWTDAACARKLIHQRKQAARLVQAQSAKGGQAAPAWKPIGYRALGARRASEIEPHSDAEYAYLQLPIRFQGYINEYLQDSERILFAVRRPAMRSAVQRALLRRTALQEGLLLITDQQVVLACEIMPPDLTGIRYGYAIEGGVPERVASASVRRLTDRALLDITWQTRTASQTTTWEFPEVAEAELTEAAALLRGWQPVARDTRLRRAYGPQAAEVQWCDPGSPDPTAVAPLADRLTQALRAELERDERTLATALLPAWAAADKCARGLAVTDRRMLWLADPASNRKQSPVTYGLNQIGALEFRSSIIESWLAFHMLSPTGPQRIVLAFPYTAADFRACYIALRQQLVALAPG